MSVYMLIAIRYEERDLVGLFGKDYEDYRAEVGMLTPRLQAAPKPDLEAEREADRRADVVVGVGDVARLAAVEQIAAEPAVAAEQARAVAQLGVDLAAARA